MDNIELEQKIKEIIAIENYFDMKVAINEFESEYKKSDFYKKTKMSLKDVVSEARMHYALHLEGLGDKIQKLIDSLSIQNINDLLDKIERTFGTENAEIGEMLDTIKDLR